MIRVAAASRGVTFARMPAGAGVAWLAGPLAHRLGGPFDDDDDGFGDEDLGAWSEDDEGSAEPALERGSQVGRNEPCPCGSGKKYKRCCLPR